MEEGVGSHAPTRRSIIKGAATVAIGVGALALTGSSRGASHEITECGTIDESGEYTLVEDLASEGDCLRLAAEQITLHGDGHRLVGEGAASGIVIDERTSAEEYQIGISNLSIQGFHTGVELEGAPVSLTLQDLDLRNNETGIWLPSVPGSSTIELTDSDILDGGLGLFGGFDDRVSIIDTLVRGHTGVGVQLGEGVVVEMDDSSVHNNAVGLLVGPNGTLRVGHSTIEENDDAGIALWMAGSGDVRTTTIRNNGGPGIEVIEGPTDVSISQCTLEDNDDHAVRVAGEELSVAIDRSDIRKNAGGVTATTIERSSVVDNDDHGVGLQGGMDAGFVAMGNHIEGNSGAGIVGLNGSGQIEDNDLRDNMVGVLIPEDGASTVAITRNTIAGNTEYGVRNLTNVSVDARCTYWGDPSGPTHPDNPQGTGDPVTEGVIYRPWSLIEIADGEGDCRGGVTPTPTPTPPPADRTPTPTPTPTPLEVATPTPAEDPLPGFGVRVGLLGFGAVVYLLARFGGDKPDS